jgi:DNA modification methylase
VTPYYDADGITIYHGDALDVLAYLRRHGELFDIAVTSPPYNMGLVPGGNGRGMYRPGASNKAGRFRDGYDAGTDDAMPWPTYDAWQRQIIHKLLKATRYAVYYNNRSRVIHGRLRLPLDGRYDGLPLRQMIVWDRGTGIDVNLRNYCTAHELILLFAHDAFRLADHSASGASDVWRLGMNHDRAVEDHPAPFPVSLPARAIATSGARSVIDPFMGSGTTLRAAKDAGVRAVGIEKSERYCEIAARRLAQGALDFGTAS